MVQQLTFTFEKLLPILTPDDIYASLDAGLVAALKEDRRIERKPAGTHNRVLGEYYSMWANTAPDGGLIFLGVEDRGQISGCSHLSQNELNEREKSGRTHCPDARSESKRIQLVNLDGEIDFVLAIRVFYREDKVVTEVGGNAYIRIGDSKTRLSDQEVRELQNDKGQVDLEREPTVIAYPQDFNIELIRQFCEGVKKGRQLLTQHSREEILEHRRLGKMAKGKFRPNVACALAFAADPGAVFPGCKVRFLRFDGEREETGTDYNVVKDITIEGPVPVLITETAATLRQQLREFSKFGADGKFYTVPEYPEEAWYEVIVNACVHRSYGLKNMNIMVKMFDDRLVVESPGGFPPFVTPENIYTAHHPRNPKLMDAMFYLDFVKCHNEGTRRIRDAMEKMNLPEPEFAQKEINAGYTAVRVTLRNSAKQRVAWIDSDASKVIGEEESKLLTPEERRVVNFAAEQGSLNVSDCQRILPTVKTWHTAKAILKRLVAKGILTEHRNPNIQKDPKAHFKLTDTPIRSRAPKK
jgi:ATP-dependent DNA helicase RecG